MDHPFPETLAAPEVYDRKIHSEMKRFVRHQPRNLFSTTKHAEVGLAIAHTTYCVRETIHIQTQWDCDDQFRESEDFHWRIFQETMK
ncbi:MAG: hypothetical protein DRQ65_02860 [Gammaproteobacteria bacterium]|nr:MAG: hypothetical protein DRQ65_02860 [Gammaproteobacteria bacterium]